MATVSGTFTAVGQSAVLDVPAVGEEITASLTGTWVATVRLERELSPYANVWEVIRSDTGNYSIVIQQKRKNERYRFNTTAFTSGTVSFSVADADLRLDTLVDTLGNEILRYDESGIEVPGTLDVTGTFTPSGNVDVGGALTVTGAATITGALTATDGGGAISGTTLTADVIEAGDASLGINGLDAAQGGEITLIGGTSSTAGNAGGATLLTGGVPGSTGVGGAVTLLAGAGGSSSGTGGAVAINAGAGSAGNAQGGVFSATGGNGDGSSAGGSSSAIGGVGGASGAGGASLVTGGAGGSSSGTGGAASLTGGIGAAGNANGGDVNIEGGLQNGSGTAGAVNVGPTNTDIVNIGHSASTTNQLGTMNQTSQPAFLAYNSAQDANVTGDGTVATVDFDTEVFDQGADFATDTFTAPVAGRYLLTTNVRVSGITALADDYSVAIVASNRSFNTIFSKTDDIPTTVTHNLTAVVDMDASDTATVTAAVSGLGAVVDVEGDASAVTSFSGCLLA